MLNVFDVLQLKMFKISQNIKEEAAIIIHYVCVSALVCTENQFYS